MKTKHIQIIPHGNHPVPHTGLYYCDGIHYSVQQDCCYAVITNDMNQEDVDKIIEVQPEKPEELSK